MASFAYASVVRQQNKVCLVAVAVVAWHAEGSLPLITEVLQSVRSVVPVPRLLSMPVPKQAPLPPVAVVTVPHRNGHSAVLPGGFLLSQPMPFALAQAAG